MVTVKTHINPCFWSALWNESYYQDIVKKGSSSLRARKQIINYLELRSNKVLLQKVENVHFEKGLGLSKITPEGIINFCKKYHPGKYQDFIKKMDGHPEDLYLDFEDHFTALEKLPVYQVLLKIAHQKRLQTEEDFVWLAQFLLIHPLRSHIFINKATQAAKVNGDEKFVLFYFLKWSLADPNFLLPQALGILNSEWNFYVLKDKIFPLSDQPVIIKKSIIVATLSPTIILFIKREVRQKIQIKAGRFNVRVNYWSKISLRKYLFYKMLTITSAHKGLIFSDNNASVRWRSSFIWILRRKLLRIS